MWPIFDNTRLARAHPAGHGLFERDMADNIISGGDLCGSFHHGRRPAAVNNGTIEGALLDATFAEEAIERLCDEAFHAEGAVIGGDDGGVAVLAEFLNVIGLVVDGVNGQEIFPLSAEESRSITGSLVQESSEVDHGRYADATSDEAREFNIVRDGKSVSERTENRDGLAGLEPCEEMRALSDDAVDDVEFRTATVRERLAMICDGEGPPEVGQRGDEVGICSFWFVSPLPSPLEGAQRSGLGRIAAVDLHELAGNAGWKVIQKERKAVVIRAELSIGLNRGEERASRTIVARPDTVERRQGRHEENPY